MLFTKPPVGLTIKPFLVILSKAMLSAHRCKQLSPDSGSLQIITYLLRTCVWSSGDIVSDKSSSNSHLNPRHGGLDIHVVFPFWDISGTVFAAVEFVVKCNAHKVQFKKKFRLIMALKLYLFSPKISNKYDTLQ